MISRVNRQFRAWEFGYGQVYKEGLADDVVMNFGDGTGDYHGADSIWNYRRSTSNGGFPWNMGSPISDGSGDNEFVYRLMPTAPECNADTKTVYVQMNGVMKQSFDEAALATIGVAEAPVLVAGQSMQISYWNFVFNDDYEVQHGQQTIQWNIAMELLAGRPWFPIK